MDHWLWFGGLVAGIAALFAALLDLSNVEPRDGSPFSVETQPPDRRRVFGLGQGHAGEL